MGKLTSVSCRAKLKTPGRHGDGGGLFYRVLPGEKAYWVYRYRIAGREREMSLGVWPTVSLAQARILHAVEYAKVKSKEKIDPLAEKHAATFVPRAVPTFGVFADQYIETHEAAWRNAKHRYQWRQTLTQYCGPIRDLPLDQVAVEGVLSVLTPLWTRAPATASRLRGRIEAILAAAQARGLMDANRANPARWKGYLDKLLPNPKKIGDRTNHPAMPYADVPAFIAQLKAMSGVAPAALLFTILTAARSGEVMGMEWSEVDFDAATWTVPAKKMKAGKEHPVPLSDVALVILREQLKGRGRNTYVFPGARPTKPLSINAFGMVMCRMGEDVFVPHGFRASFRSWCADQGVAFEVAESALAHAPGSSVVQAYQRSAMLERRRPVMQAWANYLASEPSAKVESIQEGRKRFRNEAP
jgi:integrase